MRHINRLGLLIPLAWYGGVTLGIPALRGATGSPEFWEHAMWTGVMAVAAAGSVWIGRAIWAARQGGQDKGNPSLRRASS